MSSVDEKLRAHAESANGERLLSLDLVTLANVEPEAVQWLWRGRVARGKVKMVVGDPGDGKSYLTLAIAAAVSNGNALPAGEAIAPTAHASRSDCSTLATSMPSSAAGEASTWW